MARSGESYNNRFSGNNSYLEGLDDLTLQELLSNQPTNYFNNQPLQPTLNPYSPPIINTPTAPVGIPQSPGPRTPHVPLTPTPTSTKPIPELKGEESRPTKDDQQLPIKPPREESLPTKDDQNPPIKPPRGPTNPHHPDYDPDIFNPGGDVIDNPNYGPNNQIDTGWFNQIPIGPIRNTDMPVYDEDANLSSLFGSISRMPRMGDRVGGGTGGGSAASSGNMDANALIGLSPYMDKNVTSFDQGGNLSSDQLDSFPDYVKNPVYHNIYSYQKQAEAMRRANPGVYDALDSSNSRIDRSVLSRSTYDQGGEINYSVDPYEAPASNFNNMMVVDGKFTVPASEGQINKIRREEFMQQSGLRPNYIDPNKSDYMKAYKGELKRRDDEAFYESLRDGTPTFSGPREKIDLKNPWEQGYDDWYNPSQTYNKGGQLTPTEMRRVQSLGENGDTQLAHINSQEAQMLKAMGGSGTINPYTGLPEYHYKGWNPLNSHNRGHASDAVSDAFSFVGDNIVDPIGDVLTEGVNVVGGAATDIIDAGVSGITNVVKDVGDVGHSLIRAVGDPINDIVGGLLGMGGSSQQSPGYTQAAEPIKRSPLAKNIVEKTQPGVKLSPQSKLSQIQKDKKTKLQEGDWVGDKPNPYLAPNIEQEVDYAAHGMRMHRYNQGGAMHRMPDGTMMAGATHPQGYNQGGVYEQAANQAIAQNQLSGLVANLMNRRMPMQMPQANYGMRMKRRYTQGGRF